MIVRAAKPRNRAALLLCLLAIAALGLDAWQRSAQRAGARMWLDSAICATAAPAQTVVLEVTTALQSAWSSAVKARSLMTRNAALTNRVADLQAKLNALEERYAELKRERELRQAYVSVDRPAQMAHVIGIGAGGWGAYYSIDQGQVEGVRMRDVAVTREGVVGQVYAIANHTARVLPITDAASGVAVRVQRSREAGVLRGLGAWRCEMQYMGPQAQVRPGDELVTAGTGGVFPKGLQVGKVTTVSPDPLTSGRVAAVEPEARLQNVEEVLLLRALPEG